MDGWTTSFPLGRPIFRCYVSFREGISWKIDYGMGVLNSFDMACRFPGFNRVCKNEIQRGGRESCGTLFRESSRSSLSCLVGIPGCYASVQTDMSE